MKEVSYWSGVTIGAPVFSPRSSSPTAGSRLLKKFIDRVVESAVAVRLTRTGELSRMVTLPDCVTENTELLLLVRTSRPGITSPLSVNTVSSFDPSLNVKEAKTLVSLLPLVPLRVLSESNIKLSILTTVIGAEEIDLTVKF